MSPLNAFPILLFFALGGCFSVGGTTGSDASPQDASSNDAAVADAAANTSFHFVMIHLEAFHKGPSAPDFTKILDDVPAVLAQKPLGIQEHLWPALTRLIADADSFSFRLTLAFNPQWADFVAATPQRIAQVKSWQQTGHEVAFHHHPATHPDWNGYTNDATKQSDPLYLGDVNAGFNKVKQLAAPSPLTAAMIGGLPGDIPSKMLDDSGDIVLTAGNQHDSVPGGAKPLASLQPSKVKGTNGFIYWLNHRETGTQASYSITEAITTFSAQYQAMKPEEVFGLAFHCFDYHREHDKLKAWLSFIKKQGGNVRTVSDLMAAYPYAVPLGAP